jgi:hypothetical protein
MTSCSETEFIMIGIKDSTTPRSRFFIMMSGSGTSPKTSDLALLSAPSSKGLGAAAFPKPHANCSERRSVE